MVRLGATTHTHHSHLPPFYLNAGSMNGTLAGPSAAVDAYITHTSADARFAGVDWKKSNAGSTSAAFDGLQVKVRRVCGGGGIIGIMVAWWDAPNCGMGLRLQRPWWLWQL